MTESVLFWIWFFVMKMNIDFIFWQSNDSKWRSGWMKGCRLFSLRRKSEAADCKMKKISTEVWLRLAFYYIFTARIVVMVLVLECMKYGYSISVHVWHNCVRDQDPFDWEYDLIVSNKYINIHVFTHTCALKYITNTG